MARHIQRPCLPFLPACLPACLPARGRCRRRGAGGGDGGRGEDWFQNCFMRCWGSKEGPPCVTGHPFRLHWNSKPPAVIHIAAALSSAVSRATQGVTLRVVASYIAMKTVRVDARRGWDARTALSLEAKNQA
ncbi:hypothetical protein LZ31DRAFT_572649 [Colletotrichum somersetense]|nr:hypothetical protein LZ31DRAFT_572649 [Colletotrichum somersetense]